MNNLPLFFVFIFLFTKNTSAQSFERKVYASAGKELKNNPLLFSSVRYMTFTIGEPLIFGGTTSSSRITNGFIQPDGTSAVSPPAVSALAEANNPFVVYPNPSADFFIVEAPEESIERVHLQLIDLNGKLILETDFSSLKYKLELPEGTAPGTYFLNFYHENGIFIQQAKLVKVHGTATNTNRY
jgi:hypothetical protein